MEYKDMLKIHNYINLKIAKKRYGLNGKMLKKVVLSNKKCQKFSKNIE